MNIKIIIFLFYFATPIDLFSQEKWPDANETTFEDRVKKSVLNNNFDKDVLLFPNSFGKNPNSPLIKLKGSGPIYNTPNDNNSYYWKAVPLKEEHKEYLTMRQQFIKNNELDKIFEWCKSKKLDDCLEYELRNKLNELWDFHTEIYQVYRKMWYPLANKHYIETSFPLPLKGEWFVIVDKTKHHQIKAGAAFAFDLTKKEKEKMFKTDGKKLEDYYGWNQPVYAQADGVVIIVESKYPDIEIGKFGAFEGANVVSVNYGNGICGFYGHFKQNSIKVKVGDKVKLGDIIGYTGNSGASGQPHLHFTLMDLSGISLKGRFDFQYQSENKWVDSIGQDLPEGKLIKEK